MTGQQIRGRFCRPHYSCYFDVVLDTAVTTFESLAHYHCFKLGYPAVPDLYRIVTHHLLLGISDDSSQLLHLQGDLLSYLVRSLFVL